jgi:hypothetical protein
VALDASLRWHDVRWCRNNYPGQRICIAWPGCRKQILYCRSTFKGTRWRWALHFRTIRRRIWRVGLHGSTRHLRIWRAGLHHLTILRKICWRLAFRRRRYCKRCSTGIRCRAISGFSRGRRHRGIAFSWACHYRAPSNYLKLFRHIIRTALTSRKYSWLTGINDAGYPVK